MNTTTNTVMIKENFNFSGGYLEYCEDGYLRGKRHFIARFKYGRKPWKTWVKFLCANFTLEEYVDRINQHGIENTPLSVMESKGFTLPNRSK